MDFMSRPFEARLLYPEPTRGMQLCSDAQRIFLATLKPMVETWLGSITAAQSMTGDVCSWRPEDQTYHFTISPCSLFFPAPSSLFFRDLANLH
jgi:hypothetical protein